ncbi:hypothetical protein HW555_006964 [Spodoptera exigua]|uniref:Copper transport protein n=1 Tax=Spodoptera exigua TaxID=7107 RepID=A0A835GHQ0_SPOEX|nr:hypothetical protein HW555_006964 [Spodoptera exigua]
MDTHMSMGHAHHDHGNHMNMNHMMPAVDHDMSMNSTFQGDIISNTFNGSDDSINYKSDLRAHAHHGHGGHEGLSEHAGGHDMAMTFHGGYNEVILFSWWKVTDIGEFVGSFFAVFLMALLYEGLKYYRKHLLWKTYTGLQYCAVSPPDKGVANLCAPDEPQSYNDEHSARMADSASWITSFSQLYVDAGIHDLQHMVMCCSCPGISDRVLPLWMA